MVSYLIRRIAAVVALLIALSIVVFLLFNALPADPAALTCGKSCTPQVIAANRHRLGLDKPLVQQYEAFVKGVFVGRTYGSGTQTFECPKPCLGYSFNKGEDVTALILDRFAVTAQLAAGAFIMWLILGVGFGVYAALRRGTLRDRGVLGLALLGYSFPSFFIGEIAVFVVLIKLQWLPNDGYVSPFDDFNGWWQNLLLPWFTLAVLYAAYYVRLTRNQMLETLGEDYIRTARAKGLPERIVIRKHALRAGLTPIVTSAGLDLAGLLGGAVITEYVFRLNGLGSLALDSVVNADLPTITGTVLVAAAFIIVMNLVVDVLYAVIDPRVRLA
ncbi:MAG: ABC transporter permease [Actinomycetes bacterium]